MSTRVLPRAVAAAVVLVIAATAAGCGDDSDSEAGTSDASATSTSSDAAGESDVVAAARDAIAALEQEPTDIPATTPLPRRPDPDQTLVALECEVPQCALVSEAIEEAATAVGWRYVGIPFEAYNPATLAPALQRALDEDPVAVILAGTPQELWLDQIPRFEAAGVALIPYFIGPATLSETVPANIASPYLDQTLARHIVQWLIADSGGDANVLVQNVGGSPTINGWVENVERELADLCPDCEVSVIENSGAQATGGTGATTAIVSQLRADPSLDYFISYNAAFFPGLSQALENAGLDVRIASISPLPQNVSDIMNGDPRSGAFIALNPRYVGWLSVDAALRYSVGAPQLPDDQALLPVKLVTPESVEESDADFDAPTDYRDEFLSLWQVE